MDESKNITAGCNINNADRFARHANLSAALRIFMHPDTLDKRADNHDEPRVTPVSGCRKEGRK